jgi:hypothetical protein
LGPPGPRRLAVADAFVVMGVLKRGIFTRREGRAGEGELAPSASSPGRSRPAGGEARAMAQTSQAWDWGVDLRDEERYELERLRKAVAELRTQLDEARDSLRRSNRRQEEARQALRELDAAKPWQRRRVRSALRTRQLL